MSGWIEVLVLSLSFMGVCQAKQQKSRHQHGIIVNNNTSKSHLWGRGVSDSIG